jgi:hypothetical protein
MGRILDWILDGTRFGSGHRGALDRRTWQDKLDRTKISSDPLWVLDHRVLGRTWQGVFLGLGFLRGAPLCAESEGFGSLIDDKVVCF